jgi:hypothetical protein
MKLGGMCRARVMRQKEYRCIKYFGDKKLKEFVSRRGRPGGSIILKWT